MQVLTHDHLGGIQPRDRSVPSFFPSLGRSSADYDFRKCTLVASILTGRGSRCTLKPSHAATLTIRHVLMVNFWSSESEQRSANLVCWSAKGPPHCCIVCHSAQKANRVSGQCPSRGVNFDKLGLSPQATHLPVQNTSSETRFEKSGSCRTLNPLQSLRQSHSKVRLVLQTQRDIHVQ